MAARHPGRRQRIATLAPNTRYTWRVRSVYQGESGPWSNAASFVTLDPAIVNLVATKEGLSPHEVETLLNTQSGLLGLSGLTNDMKVLEEELKEHDDERI